MKILLLIIALGFIHPSLYAYDEECSGLDCGECEECICINDCEEVDIEEGESIEEEE